MIKYRFCYLFVFIWAWCSSVAAQDLLQPGKIARISITFETDDWDRLLDSLKQNNSKKRLPATVTINNQTYTGCRVRYKGNSSYFNVRNARQPKLPFNIEAAKDKLFDQTYNTLKLSNNFRDPALIREVLSYEIVRKYMHASQAGFVQLKVNGKDYGLYTLTEPVQHAIVARWTGVPNGTLIKCDPDWNTQSAKGCPPGDKASLIYLGDDESCYTPFYELEAGANLQPLIALCRILQKKPADIDHVLAVDETLWMLALNQALVNLDSYTGKLSHNYYLYCDSAGTCLPIMWDFNLSLGGFAYDGATTTALTTDQLSHISPFLHYDNPKRPLISVLFKDQLYRHMYVAHLRTIERDFLSSGLLAQRAKALSSQIEAVAAQDQIALYPIEQTRKNIQEPVVVGKYEIPGIIRLVQARSDFLKAHPALSKPQPDLNSVTHTVVGDKVIISAQSVQAKTVTAFIRPPGTLRRYKQPLTLNAGRWTTEWPYAPGTTYFVVADTDEAATCYPENSSKDAIVIK